MQIVYKQLEEIKPYKKNPRKNDKAAEKVANSIKEFGFKSPIIVDKNGVIIAGHTRYKAAKMLGMAKVPCITADDLTDAQIKAYRLADNKTAELAEWDFGLLHEELDGLADIQMQDFGFYLDDAIAFDHIFEPQPQKEKPPVNEPRMPYNEPTILDVKESTEPIETPTTRNTSEIEHDSEVEEENNERYIVKITFESIEEADQFAEKMREDGYCCEVGAA